MIDLSKFTPAQREALLKWWAAHQQQKQPQPQPQQPAQS